MRTLSAIAALLIAAAFCCAEANPASAQVMKNFSWKKKQKPKAQDAAQAKPAETGQTGHEAVPKRRKTQPGN
jgi:hypothetical protein